MSIWLPNVLEVMCILNGKLATFRYIFFLKKDTVFMLWCLVSALGKRNDWHFK